MLRPVGLIRLQACMQMVNVTVIPAANMTLTFEGGHAIGVIGPARRCKVPLKAIANVTGPANAISPPTGNVTLTITSLGASLIPVHLVKDKVCAFLAMPMIPS